MNDLIITVSQHPFAGIFVLIIALLVLEQISIAIVTAVRMWRNK